jgi:hypothetical protein
VGKNPRAQDAVQSPARRSFTAAIPFSKILRLEQRAAAARPALGDALQQRAVEEIIRRARKNDLAHRAFFGQNDVAKRM